MSTGVERIFVARLAGTTVFDPLGDAVGRVRDVVLLMRRSGAPTAVGLVVEVPGRRRVFMPLTRVTSINPGQVICTGVVNLRRFQARASETLAIGELFERSVTLKAGRTLAYIEDIAIEQGRGRVWQVTKLYVRSGERRRGVLGFSRKGASSVVDLDEVTGLATRDKTQGAALVIQSFADYKPADLAAALMEMSPARSAEIAGRPRQRAARGRARGASRRGPGRPAQHPSQGPRGRRSRGDGSRRRRRPPRRPAQPARPPSCSSSWSQRTPGRCANCSATRTTPRVAS